MAMTSNELEQFKQSILDAVRVMMQTTGQVTQYVGARYVPLFAEPFEWSDQKEYEPLTIVTHQGNSFTSRQFVPKGIGIDNAEFWASTGNYNAQIEQYRREVAALSSRIDAFEGAIESKAPINHATDSTEYGVGNAVNYGHLKLMDSTGIAASKQYLNGVSFTNDLFLTATKGTASGTVNFYFTDDFKNMYPLKKEVKIFPGCDFIYLSKINNFYYIFTNDYYAVTEDFSDFNVKRHTIASNTKYGEWVWGYKIDPLSMKCIACVKYSDNTVPNTFGSTYYFRPYILDVSQNPITGELSFTNMQELAVPNFTPNNSSYIDVDFIYSGNKYYIVFKDELTTKAVFFKATTLNETSTWEYVANNSPYFGYEGPKLIETNGKIYMLVSYYGFSAFLKSKFTNVNDNVFHKIENKPTVFVNPFNSNELFFSNMEGTNHHMGVIKVDSVIGKAFDFVYSYVSPYEIVMETNAKSDKLYSTEYTGPIIPNFTIFLSGQTSLTINPSSIRDFVGSDKKMQIIVNTNHPETILKFTGNYTAVDIKDKNLFKQAGDTPTSGYNCFPGQIKKIGVFPFYDVLTVE